jgi:hypothetical protein
MDSSPAAVFRTLASPLNCRDDGLDPRVPDDTHPFVRFGSILQPYSDKTFASILSVLARSCRDLAKCLT